MMDETNVAEMRILLDSKDLSAGGAVQDVPIASLFRRDNVRTAATLQIPTMVASLRRHGFKRNHPLVVSAKRNGSFLVLVGNRRCEAIETIFANEPDLAAALFPSGCVPCVVHAGLTEEQEVLLRVDHSEDEDRVPLDDFGEFLAIRQLVRAGYDTQAGIAEKMGWFKTDKKTGAKTPNRSRVQQRVNLAQLPQFVQDEMQRYCEEPSQSNLRWSSIPKLYKAYSEEYRQTPDGDGPIFQAAWKEAIAGAATTGTGVPIKPITPADAEKRSKLVGSRNLRNALMTFAGVGAETLTDIDGAIVRAETAESILTEIADYLGQDDFNELVKNAGELAKSKLAAQAEVAADADLAEAAG